MFVILEENVFFTKCQKRPKRPILELKLWRTKSKLHLELISTHSENLKHKFSEREAVNASLDASKQNNQFLSLNYTILCHITRTEELNTPYRN